MLGLSHRTADLTTREAVALTEARLDRLYATLHERYPGVEAVAVSTCNRTELYIARPVHQSPDGDDLRGVFAEAVGVAADRLAAVTVRREQEQAAAHLFRVACGVDSMVVGEPEILGQLKRAYLDANARGHVGPVLHKVFQDAMATAKRVRHETGIGQGRVSVASVAVEFARGVFEGFADKTVLALGGGEAGKSIVKRLMEAGAGKVLVANRTASRAVDLAAKLGLTSRPGSGARAWDDLQTLLVEADVVLSATAASEPVLTESMLRGVVKRRRRRPLVIVDVAVPRDAEASIAALPNVFLYNVDDLRGVVEQTFTDRGDCLAQCEAKLLESAHATMSEVQHRDVGRLVRELRRRLHDLGEEEQARTRRRARQLLAADPDAVDELVAEHTHRLLNKVLHLPLSRLDPKDSSAPLGFYAAALRRLFDLDAPPPEDADPERSWSAAERDQPQMNAEPRG